MSSVQHPAAKPKCLTNSEFLWWRWCWWRCWWRWSRLWQSGWVSEEDDYGSYQKRQTFFFSSFLFHTDRRSKSSTVIPKMLKNSSLERCLWQGGGETGVTHKGSECVLVRVRVSEYQIYILLILLPKWIHFWGVRTFLPGPHNFKGLLAGENLEVRARLGSGVRGVVMMCVLPPASSCPHQGGVYSAFFESPTFHKGRSMKSIKRSIEINRDVKEVHSSDQLDDKA